MCVETFYFIETTFLLLVLSATVQSAPPEFPPLPFLISGFQLGNCTSGWVTQMWDKKSIWQQKSLKKKLRITVHLDLCLFGFIEYLLNICFFVRLQSKDGIDK